MVRAAKYPGQDEWEQAFKASMDRTGDLGDAKKLASRRMHESGYYQTKDGWVQLGPDLRGKINVRDAEEQPDGSFIIRDVDAFYPNAVKGGEDETTWTAERVQRAIDNTNKAIASGGQPTSVTRGHVYPEQKMLGVSIPSWGSAINWRLSPRGPGWARCDLVDVHADVVKDWKDRKITGLSAGFVQDAGLNERFGHLALLGGESQALASLPSTQIYSANGLAQLCYSADSSEVAQMHFDAKQVADDLPGPKTTLDANVPTQEIVMDPKHAQTMKSAYSSLSTAYAGLEAGEPGAEEKVAEAHAALDAAAQACKMAGGNDMGGAPPMADQDNGMGFMGDTDTVDAEDEEGYTASQEAQEETYLPEKTKSKLTDITGTEVEVASTPGKNFSAKAINQNFSALQRENRELRIAVAALTGRQLRNDFAAEVKKLIDNGHQIEMNSALKMFSACDGKKDRISALMNLLKSFPKSGLTSGVPTFAADENNGSGHEGAHLSAGAQATDDEVMNILRKHGGGVNYSAEDLRIGSIQTGLGAGGRLSAQ